jgi:hypothetical protein
MERPQEEPKQAPASTSSQARPGPLDGGNHSVGHLRTGRLEEGRCNPQAAAPGRNGETAQHCTTQHHPEPPPSTSTAQSPAAVDANACGMRMGMQVEIGDGRLAPATAPLTIATVRPVRRHDPAEHPRPTSLGKPTSQNTDPSRVQAGRRRQAGLRRASHVIV